LNNRARFDLHQFFPFSFSDETVRNPTLERPLPSPAAHGRDAHGGVAGGAGGQRRRHRGGPGGLQMER